MKTLFSVLLGILTLTIVGCGNAFQSNKGDDQALSIILPESRFLLGAMGDSITRGYDIKSLGSEDVADNWATGVSLSGSLFNHFITSFGSVTSVSAVNVAVVGETVLGSSSTFQSQATALAAQNPAAVVIEIGANDVCQGKLATAGAAASFKANIVQALTALKGAQKSPSAIVVASIPHIFALTQISTLASNNNCQAAWALLCPNISAGATAFEAQWAAANQALKEAVAQVGAPAVYDEGAVAKTTFSAADVSAIDCFHPSVNGQTKLATAIWQGFSGNFTPVVP